MILKFFRKPYLALLLSSVILFVSCTSEEVSNKQVTSEELKQFHNSLKSELKDFELNSITSKSTDELQADAEKLYYENAEYLNKNGTEAMLIKNNIDPIILEQFEYYQQNFDNENVYQMLLDKYNFKTLEDAELLFNFIEIYNHTVDKLGLEDVYAKARISYSCALAITATVVATASAVTIAAGTAGAGTALAFWVVGKALATLSVMDSCR